MTLAPAAHLWSAGRARAALGWTALALALGLAGLLVLLADPTRAEGLRTLERFTGEGLAASARPVLWAEALRWAGETLPWGLGTGGFTLAAGNGERRGLYAHNHALEALSEAGLPGILLWLGAFGGGAALLLGRLRALPAGAAGRLVALVLPVALGAMVSTDMGNRMVWFALGLALSAGLVAVPRAHAGGRSGDGVEGDGAGGDAGAGDKAGTGDEAGSGSGVIDRVGRPVMARPVAAAEGGAAHG